MAMRSALIAVLLWVAGAMAAVNFPYPYYTNYGGRALVVANASKAATLYTKFTTWKDARYIESGSYARIEFSEAGKTVSEGVGYAMLMMVYFSGNTTNYPSRQAEFDKLWAYYQRYSKSNHIMNWKVSGFDNPPGCSGNDCNGATDGDIDVAAALVMAYYQFGDAKYKTAAQMMIDAIYDNEVSQTSGLTNLLKPGDVWESEFNPSYFSAAAVNLFGKFDSNNKSRWSSVLTRNHQLIKANMHSTTGLVLDWCKADGSDSRGTFGYDAVRTPWRLAWSAAWYASDTDSKAYATKVGAWIRGKASNPAGIMAGYNKDGSATASYTNSVYLGAFGSAVAVEGASAGQTYLNTLWNTMMGVSGDNTNYYNGGIRLLYGLLIGGMFPNMMEETPGGGSSSSVASSSSIASSSSSKPSSSSVASSSSSKPSSSSVASSSSSKPSSSSIASSSSVASSSSAASASCEWTEDNATLSKGTCSGVEIGQSDDWGKERVITVGLGTVKSGTSYTLSFGTNKSLGGEDMTYTAKLASYCNESPKLTGNDTTTVSCKFTATATADVSLVVTIPASRWETVNIFDLKLVDGNGNSTPVQDVRIDMPLFAQVSGNVFYLNTGREGLAQVQVFDLTGKSEKILHTGYLAAGSHEFSLASLKAGMYLVRVVTPQGSISQTVMVRQ